MSDQATILQLFESLPAAKRAVAARLLDALQAVDLDEAEQWPDALEQRRAELTVRAFQRAGAPSTLYDTDFYAWTQAQAAVLRAKDVAALDLDHLAEEIESLGNEQRHAVRSHLRVLLWHLLKWAYQARYRTPSWRTSILNARAEVGDRLTDAPSLRPRVPSLLASAYPQARRLAAAETNLPLATFPETCPWDLAQVLDPDFWPEAEGR